MKIIDFETRGNVVRFYLGADDLQDWYGDDWDDVPYEHNAGTVYDEFVTEKVDIAFDFDCGVLEPQDDWRNKGNSDWCKNDMTERKVPCLIIVPQKLYLFDTNFSHYVGMDGVHRIYFGDDITTVYQLECCAKILKAKMV